MRKFIILILALMSMSAMADQVIFSQYDGDHTWTNMIINVTNAKLFIEPGVAFVSATDGYRNIASPSIFGVKGVKAVAGVAWSARVVNIVTGTPLDPNIPGSGSVTYNFVQTAADSSNYTVTHSKQDPTWETATFNATWSDAALDSLASGQVAYTDIAEVLEADAVEGVEEIKAKKARVASREEPQVAKAVVVVPKDANMYFFVLYFFDQRITYLQLLDNYQQMHPLVPFTGNK